VASASRQLRGLAHLSNSPATSGKTLHGDERELDEETELLNQIAQLEEGLGLDDDEGDDDKADGDDQSDGDVQSPDAGGPDDQALIATNSTLEQGNVDETGSEPIDDLSKAPAAPAETTVLGNPEPSNGAESGLGDSGLPDVVLDGANSDGSEPIEDVSPAAAATNPLYDSVNLSLDLVDPPLDAATEPAVSGNPELSNATMPDMSDLVIPLEPLFDTVDLSLDPVVPPLDALVDTVDPPLDPDDSVINDATTRSAERPPADDAGDNSSLDASGYPQDASETSSSSGTAPEPTETAYAETNSESTATEATLSLDETENPSDEEADGTHVAPEVVPPVSLYDEDTSSSTAPETVPPASPYEAVSGIDRVPDVVPFASPYDEAARSSPGPSDDPYGSPYGEPMGGNEGAAGDSPAPDGVPNGYGNSDEAPIGYGAGEVAPHAGYGEGPATEEPPVGDSSSNTVEYPDEYNGQTWGQNPTDDESAEQEEPSIGNDASEENTGDVFDFEGADTDDAETEPVEEIRIEDNPWKDPKWADKTPEEVAALAEADALRVMQAKYIPLILIAMTLVSTAFTLFVAQQMVENPNGMMAKICRCMVAVARIVTFPLRYCLCGADCSRGARNRRRDRRTHDVLRNEVLRNRNGEFS
jgi:hypothetical protein